MTIHQVTVDMTLVRSRPSAACKGNESWRQSHHCSQANEIPSYQEGTLSKEGHHSVARSQRLKAGGINRFPGL
jgi:hypothetical protein